MAEMFGLSRPVPQTIRISPRKKVSLPPAKAESPMEMWPAEMQTAP